MRRCRRRPAGGLASIVGIALVLAGCSATPATPAPTEVAQPSVEAPSAVASEVASPSDSPAEPSPSPLDPCALITRDEANTLAGVKVLDPQPAGNPPSRCVWPTPTTGAVGQVEIDVGDGAKKAYDIDATVLKHDFTTVTGVGDEAYREDKAIFFRVGDTWVEINVVRLDSPSKLSDMLDELARTVAGRL
jgi:hypothetical protein